MQSAMKGDSKAFNAISALIKEQEDKEAKAEAERIAKLNQHYHLDLDMIPDNFHAVIRDIRNEKHQEYVFKGGRGGTKSSDIAQIIIELMRNNHDVHAVVCRKVGNTLKDSVYSKIKWAIGKQGFTEEFDAHKSPLEITLKATGQKIYFRGADEPEKIKSISWSLDILLSCGLKNWTSLQDPKKSVTSPSLPSVAVTKRGYLNHSIHPSLRITGRINMS